MEIINVPEAQGTFAKGFLNVRIPFVTSILNNATLRKVKRWLPTWRWDFPTIHALAFMGWSIFCMILMLISSTETYVNSINSLYFAVSSVTLTGLAPMNVSSLSTFQQVILFLSFNVGSAITASFAVMSFRIRTMKNFHKADIGQPGPLSESTKTGSDNGLFLPSRDIHFGLDNGILLPSKHSQTDLDNGPAPNPATVSSPSLQIKHKPSNWWKDFLGKDTVGRNSTFHGLTKQERGSVFYLELNAAIIIRVAVFLYSFVLQVIGSVILGYYFDNCKGDLIRAKGINPWYA